MIRLLCIDVDTGDAANVGGPVITVGRTFDLENTAVEEWLRSVPDWHKRQVVAVEIIKGTK